MPLGMEISLGSGHIVLDGNTASPPFKKGQSPPPEFSAHVECGLGSGHIVLHGDPAPSPQRGTALNFRPMSIVAKRLPISATAEHLYDVIHN